MSSDDFKCRKMPFQKLYGRELNTDLVKVFTIKMCGLAVPNWKATKQGVQVYGKIFVAWLPPVAGGSLS